MLFRLDHLQTMGGHDWIMKAMKSNKSGVAAVRALPSVTQAITKENF